MDWKNELKLVAIGGAAGIALGVAVFGPLWSATITVDSDPVAGVAYGLNTSEFAKTSTLCGSGESVVNDGCSVVLKDNPDAPHAYGRFDPFGGSWIDSQDIGTLRWDVKADVAFTSFSFAMTDMVDQPNTWMSVTTDKGGLWETTTRLTNGALHWFTILLDAPSDSLAITIDTRHNDGYGLSAASTLPIPLPAGAWLMLAGVAALIAAQRRT